MKKRWMQIVLGFLAVGLIFGTGAGQALANTSPDEPIQDNETMDSGQTGGEAGGDGAGSVNHGTSGEETDGMETPGTETPEADVPAAQTPEEDDGQKPKLLPGDFLYFFKVMFERIKLALTFDEVEKAKLLVQYANERIAEARALLAEGDEKRALQVLQEAIENQNQALEFVGEAETQAADGTKPAANQGEVASSQPDTSEPADEPADEQTDSEQDEIQKIKMRISNNIAALLKVAEKVENPKAQAAILKNIEKSFLKLEKKLVKVENKLQRQEPGGTEGKDEEAGDTEGENDNPGEQTLKTPKTDASADSGSDPKAEGDERTGDEKGHVKQEQSATPAQDKKNINAKKDEKAKHGTPSQSEKRLPQQAKRKDQGKTNHDHSPAKPDHPSAETEAEKGSGVDEASPADEASNKEKGKGHGKSQENGKRHEEHGQKNKS